MFLSEGFTDYLAKPIEFASLEQMLLKYIPEEKITAGAVTQREDQPLPLIQAEALQQVYANLLQACEEFDYDTIVSAVEELAQYRIPDDEKERVDAICRASDDLDYDVTPELIREGRREGQDE